MDDYQFTREWAIANGVSFQDEYEKPVIFDTGGGWGDAINVSNYNDETKTASVLGWKRRKPLVGEFLRVKLQAGEIDGKSVAGRIALFKFEQVEAFRDPPDMFGATIRFFAIEGKERGVPEETGEK